MRDVSRRNILAGAGMAGIAAVAAPLASALPASPGASKLILLGTGGGPVLGGERRMAANVILVGDAAYVVDCGYGTAESLARAGVSLKQMAGLFITHNHADHMIDLGPMLFFSWLQGHADAVRLYGPPPLRSVVDHLLAANRVPLDYYRTDMHMQPMPEVVVQEIAVGGAVMQDPHVKVRCVVVQHPTVVPAYAYRFDLADRSIVFSGDTAPSDALIELARGADILVHEAADAELTVRMMAGQAGRSTINGPGGGAPAGFDPAKFAEHVYKAHTAAEQAGGVAAAAGVKTLVLNHLSPGSSRIVTDAQWTAMARRRYRGTIVVAHDGMTL